MWTKEDECINNKLAKVFNPNYTYNNNTNNELKLLKVMHKFNENQNQTIEHLLYNTVKQGCKRQPEDNCESCEENARNKKLKSNHLIIIHSNVRGLNGNLEFANNAIMTSNIAFFTECMCETQLNFENSIFAPNKKLFTKNSIKYKKKGRPTGGLIFAVDSNLNAKCKFISRRTGILMINQLAIIGSYLPSHDSRPSTEVSFKKELLQIEQEYIKLRSKNYEVMIIGDLNIDRNRIAKNYKRKDAFNTFLENSSLVIQEELFMQDIDHSYYYEYKDKNNPSITISKKSTIDYTLSSCINHNFIKVKRFNSKLNTSDHHPTIIEYNLIDNKNMDSMYSKKSKSFTNWDDKEFVSNFRERVRIGCANISRKLLLLKESTSKANVDVELNRLNLDLKSTLIQARDKAKNELYLSGRSTKPKYNGKTKKWWNDELKCAFQRVFRLKNELKENNDLNQREKISEEISHAKREFRTLKRFNLKLTRDFNLRKIDELFRNKKANFWGKLKKMDRVNQDIEADIDQIRDEFKKIFTTRNKINKKHEEKINKCFEEFVEKTKDTIYNVEVQPDQIYNYISDLNKGKSTGISNISNEMLINANCTELATTLALIFEIIINHGIIPKDFNTSILKPLVKDAKKSTKEATNLRPLAISDAISNMFEKLLLFFIDQIYVNHFKQFGFKKSSSCSHALFVLKVAMTYAKSKNKRLYAVAIDASKAFDKVNRIYLWVKLINIGVHEAIIRAIIIYYSDSIIVVGLNGELSTPFKSTVGVRQGGILSPRLFAIYVHEMISEISKAKIGIRLGKMSIDVIGYADDILLVSNIMAHLQKMLNLVDHYCDEHEIKVNGDKTVLLIFNKWIQRSKKELECDKDQTKLTLQGVTLSETYQLKYLGVEISADQTNTKHINTRCDKAMKALASVKSKGLCDKQIHFMLKSQMYKTFIMPVLTYGMELMILNKKELNQIRITESNMVKNMINVRSSCRTKPIMNALQIENLNSRLMKMKLSLYVRLNENDYTKTIISECETNKFELDFVKAIKHETDDLSTANTLVNKCKVKSEIISRSSVHVWNTSILAQQLREIFELTNRTIIPGLIMLKVSTYIPVLNFKQM